MIRIKIILRYLRIRFLLLLVSTRTSARSFYLNRLSSFSAASFHSQAYEIPRLIHIVWIGDESRAPLELINSWRLLNPECALIVWGNTELKNRQWINSNLINFFWDRKRFELVADLMRYEILYFYGGFAVDADTLCVKTLPASFFALHGFSCYENETVVPGLISNGYLAVRPRSLLLQSIIISISNDPMVTRLPGWIALGPGRLTSMYRKIKPKGFKIFPSHYFIPEHYTGINYTGPNHSVYCRQMWGSTNRSH